VRWIDDVRTKSIVMPVGVEFDWIGETEKHDPPLIIWNQRWEHDKDPERLFRALYRLAGRAVEFRLALCGENFRNVPVEFEEARHRLSRQIVHYGFADRMTYESLLLDASVVVSTAQHEFFGIAAVEAMAAGAVPVFPDKLSYPSLIPEEVHAETLYRDNVGLDELLLEAVRDPERRQQIQSVVAPSMQRFSWETVAPRYDSRLAQVSPASGLPPPA
jgi:glycosyltransferase involved in cell wall biosynthesis